MIKKIYTPLLYAALVAVSCAMAFSFSSCNDDESYADLLSKEKAAVNRFLADHKVINNIPADTVFECGPDAPYYRIDPEGQIYMQVINPGSVDDEDMRATDDELIFFRFTRYNIEDYKDGDLGEGAGNENDLSMSNTSFRFNNYTLPSSSEWGYGIQSPLRFLPIDCNVNIIVKSQMGLTDETVQVIPFLYTIRYYRAGM